jgi:hypothetical protein
MNMNIINKISITIVTLFLCNTALFAQNKNCIQEQDYLERAKCFLQRGDCHNAEKWYNVYKNMGKSNADVAKQISDCKVKKQADTDKAEQEKAQIDDEQTKKRQKSSNNSQKTNTESRTETAKSQSYSNQYEQPQQQTNNTNTMREAY